jgi:hypothetical protein
MLLCIVSFRLPDKQWLFMVSQHSHWILMLLSNETLPLHKQQIIVHYSWFIPYTYEFNSLSVNVLWQQSYNSYSQQFHQCQQTKMSPVTSNYCAQTRPRRLTLEVLYVCFVDRCLSFCTFSFGHCAVCSSSIYGFWLPLWYLQTLLRQIESDI